MSTMNGRDGGMSPEERLFQRRSMMCLADLAEIAGVYSPTEFQYGAAMAIASFVLTVFPHDVENMIAQFANNVRACAAEIDSKQGAILDIAATAVDLKEIK